MALKVVNQAEVIFNKNVLNVQAAEELDLKLFKNNHTPVDTDTEADYTEATFVGYAAIPLDHTLWVTTPGNPASSDYPTVTFTSTGGGQNETIYGYYVVQRLSGKLLWAELFSDNDPQAPYLIVNIGDNIAWEPQFTGRDETD
jgi:hypothetical protein